MRPRDPEKVAAFNAAMDAGRKVPDAAKIAGVSLPTAYNYARLRRTASSGAADQQSELPRAAQSSPFGTAMQEEPLPDSTGDFAPMEPKRFQMTMLGEQRYLKNYAQSLTRSAPDADDLLSRANIKMLENRHRFRPGTNFRAWATVILRNLFISDKRLTSSKATVSIDHANGDDEAGGPNPDTLRQFQVAPSQDSGIVVGEMKAAVLALPHDQRSALVESVVNGKGYDQIAAEAGVEEGTIKSRIHRGREALDKALPEVGALARPTIIKMPAAHEAPDPWEFVLARLYADREAIDTAIAAIKKARRMANT